MDVGGEIVLRKPTITVLGVIIDEALSFTPHMESACCRAAGRLRLLTRTARRLPFRHRASLAHALVYSTLIYCDAAMCNINQRWLNRLDEIQRGAARFVVGLPTRPRRQRCTISRKSYCWNICCNGGERIAQLRWVPLSEKRHMHLAGRVWSSCHDPLCRRPCTCQNSGEAQHIPGPQTPTPWNNPRGARQPLGRRHLAFRAPQCGTVCRPTSAKRKHCKSSEGGTRPAGRPSENLD